MRIDGLATSYPLVRPARTDGTVAPYGDSQRVVQVQREQPPGSASQGQERAAQPRQVNPGSAAGDVCNEYYPARLAGSGVEGSLSGRAAQALASYAATASLGIDIDIDADEVLGLDLYA